jgi:hypothetical protein
MQVFAIWYHGDIAGPARFGPFSSSSSSNIIWPAAWMINQMTTTEKIHLGGPAS